MSARHSQTFWVGILFALSMLSSVALADPAASVTPASGTPADPEQLMARAEKALDQEELVEAVNLYAQAAELNYTPAQVAMGDYMVAGEFFDSAVGWYLMAATQGNAAGQYGLAELYYAGKGIEKDEAKALYWYRRSAAKNFLPSVKVMALAYRKGGFSGQVPVDLDQAKSWDAKVSRLSAIEKKAADEKTAALKKIAEDEAAADAAAKKANKSKEAK